MKRLYSQAKWLQLSSDSWFCNGCEKKCMADNIDQPPVGCQSPSKSPNKHWRENGYKQTAST